MMKIYHSIDDALTKMRLDAAISFLFPDCSRKKAAALVTEGQIKVNHQHKKPGYRVKPGDLLTGEFEGEQTPEKVVPENISIDILYEDPHILVINKAPGMVVHPAPGNMSGTLVNALLFHCPEIRSAGPDPLRPGIVHRLDKDTSGLMVAAKTFQSLAFLQKEFKQRRVEKRYLALVNGTVHGETGEINLPIGRHRVKRKQMSPDPELGKPARTLWQVRERFKDACLVEALLKTGRTHQIRVHFYAADHPLLGDPVYQPRRFRKGKSRAPRQMLHACQLSFRHPYSGVRLFFKAEPPDDFRDVLESLASG